jgi:hypothetical protein
LKRDQLEISGGETALCDVPGDDDTMCNIIKYLQLTFAPELSSAPGIHARAAVETI